MMKIILPVLLLGLAQLCVGQEQLPAKKGQTKSLSKNFRFLAYGNSYTTVPKGSIANLPDRFANRILSSRPEGAKFTRFDDFFKKNRGWIRTQNLTMSQMRQLTETLEKVKENKSNLGYLVIFSYKNNPVGFRSMVRK